MSEPSTPAPLVVVLIVAHGSRNPRAAEEHERFCSLVAEAIGSDRVARTAGTEGLAQTVGTDRVAPTAGAEGLAQTAGDGSARQTNGNDSDNDSVDGGSGLDLGRLDVRPAYLELSEPSVPSAIERAVREGASTVRVLPHFLNSGNHVMVDLPGIIDASRSLHPEVEILLDSHLGADPGLVELTVQKISSPDDLGA